MASKKPSRAIEAARRITGRDAPDAESLDVDRAVAELEEPAEAPAELDAFSEAELHAQLQASDPDARAAAAIALARRGDSALFAAIVKNLRHDDKRVRVGAAVALGRIGDPRAAPNLIEAFRTEDPEIAAAVAWALGQCRDAAAVPWLLAALEHDLSPASCCEALGHIGDPRAVPGLVSALAAPSAPVRAHAARALGRVRLNGDEAATRAASRVVQALRAALRDDARRVRLCAALSLYDLGERGSDPVREALGP